MKEIVTHLGYPQSSAIYLLKSLCDGGYLNFNKVGHSYFPTTKVRSLGSWIEGHLPENTIIFDVMRVLRQQFGETVAVGTQSDLQLQYLKAIESDYPVRYHIGEGDLRPLLEAAMGWMLLSQHPSEVVESICRRTNQLVGEKRYDPNAVMVELNTIRSSGYCLLEDRSIPYHAATVAMLLPSKYNGQPMVIGLGGVLDRILERKMAIIEKMKTEIKNIM
jgi:DNA-binding IclR family transcriptional regulator